MIPLARTNNLLITKVGEEVIVYDQERDTAHCLNAIAARVWHYCDGQNTVEDIAKLLSEDLEVSADEDVDWRGLVWLTLEELERFYLIQEYLSQPISSEVQPADVSRVSRRKMIKTATLVGGFAVGSMFPLVKSIVAPAPGMAAPQSPTPTPTPTPIPSPTPTPTPTPTPEFTIDDLGFTFENVDGNIEGSFETTSLPPNDFFGDSEFGGDLTFPENLSEGEFNFESTLEKIGDTFSNMTSFTTDTPFGPLEFSPKVDLENVVPQNFPDDGLGINLKTPDDRIEINVGLTADIDFDGFEPKINSIAAGFKVSINF